LPSQHCDRNQHLSRN